MIVNFHHCPEEFRKQLRGWLEDHLPHDWPSRIVDEQSYVAMQRHWMAELASAGLAVPSWPKEFGGRGATLRHRLVMADEFARYNTPSLDLFMVSLHHLPATMMEHGTKEQQDTYLPGVALGDIWCQGFSEPNAGSDLASLRTTARRDGDVYIVNGQKIWSSFSRFARYCLLLARTDSSAPKHRGISYFIMDMDAEGVDLRPIRQATGEAEFSEMFLTDVRIPARNLIGAENAGWQIAQSTLVAERGILAFERVERMRYKAERYLAYSIEASASWVENAIMRREFVQIFAEIQAVRRLVRKLLAVPQESQASSVLAPYIKLSSSTLAQRYADFTVRSEQLDAQISSRAVKPDGQEPILDYIRSFGDTISAGSNEIMRNIIAERSLGLPRG